MDGGGSLRTGPGTASRTSLPCPEALAVGVARLLRAAGHLPAPSHPRWLERSGLWVLLLPPCRPRC
eukprot:3305218-Alexandrium_andersonii.AAC.1